jgi:hypothetical protein
MSGGVRSAFGRMIASAMMAIIRLGGGVFDRSGRRVGRSGGAEADKRKGSGEGGKYFRHEQSFVMHSRWRAGRF